MNPQEQLCPKCGASGKEEKIGIHSRQEKRYRCKVCERTFSETHGSAYYGLKKPEVFMVVVTLLAYGCPPKAVEVAYGLSANTIRDWMQRSGQHCEQVHQATVGQEKWDLVHIQADEMKITTQIGEMWLAMVMMVSTRLWLGGSVSCSRGKDLIERCLTYAAQVALCRPLLLAVDGLNMYVNAVKKTFRSRLRIGKGGRLKYVKWTNVIVSQVVKKRNGKRHDIQRVMAVGTEEEAQRLRQQSLGGTQINTSFIERLNATFRQRLAYLTRRTRAQLRLPQTLNYAMWLQGCVYNFCTYHRSLALPFYFTPRRRRWIKRTPAMVADLTDHRWTIHELLAFKVRTET